MNLESKQPKISLSVTEITSSFLKNIPLSIAAFDLNLDYIAASTMWLELMGKREEKEVIGVSIYDIVPEVTLQFKRFHQLTLKENIIKGKNFVRFPQESFWFKWEMHPWYKDHSIQGILIFAQNTTYENHYILRTEKLIKDIRRSNQELERFSQLCIHDIKEPIRGIANFIDLIEQDLDNDNKHKTKDYFSSAKNSISQLGRLINDLTLYAGLTKNNFNLQITTVNLNEVINNTRNLLSAVIAESNVKIYTSNLPTINGDKTKIVSLMQNLISNAIKYRRGITANITIGYKNFNDYWQFSVEDDGIGIDPLYCHKIFKPFSRLNANKSDYNSTGLGLYTCKKIVECHGGKIWVEAKKAHGSIFYFTIKKKL